MATNSTVMVRSTEESRVRHLQHAHSTSEAAEAPQKNYLERCVEAFSPENENHYRFQTKMWNVASIATLVAFSVLGAAAFVVTSIFAPVYVPLVAIGLLCLMGPVHQLYLKLQSSASTANTLAEQSHDIREEYAKLPEGKIEMIKELAAVGISLYKIDDISYRADTTQLRPALAFYNYWKKKSDEYQSQSTEATQKAIEYALSHPDDVSTIDEMRSQALALERNAMMAKTNAAFSFGIMKHPKFSGTFSDFASFNLMSPADRVIAGKFQDPLADAFITFSNKSMAPIRIQEVLAKDTGAIERLSDRIFAAATA